MSTLLETKHLLRKMLDWKAAFGAVLFISPLLLFCGEGLGQIFVVTNAIKVGSRLEALGKPASIQFAEEEAWKCIIDIAVGLWESEYGVGQFCQNLPTTMDSPLPDRDINFFPWALTEAQTSKLMMSHNMWFSNWRWLQKTGSIWRQVCCVKSEDSLFMSAHRRSRSVDSVNPQTWKDPFSQSFKIGGSGDERDSLIVTPDNILEPSHLDICANGHWQTIEEPFDADD
ncbi:uncharacterized protein EV420DRAFT_1653888 [Desarmillaria tabescens]|uniref:Uncharacterized protein n=1 Tax=Armillaria tabescens TaxID=1929756 RepID=A0AA39J204_ARMTA|nr:uncharacterized protein EV420DRAFT_1653888 [Desarmillaria tabescens]KAK0434662.1 hypothetical protein EV420DRAFT_1653888 [Desarmillaria tabescens]